MKITDFWQRVDKQRGGCWNWRGATNSDGYGNVFYEGTNWKAHRLSYALTSGEIPDGRHVLHRCDNPACVNPDHLFLGNHSDNMRDRAAKGRHNVGDRKGIKHPMARLSEQDVLEIRALAGTMCHREIGLRYGVTTNNIHRIIVRKSWKHI